MADVVGDFIRGHQAGQAEQDHQQQLEDNKIRSMVLKHQLAGLKIEDQLRARQVAQSNLELLHGQPAADIPSDTMTTSQPNLPSQNLAGVVNGLVSNRLSGNMGGAPDDASVAAPAPSFTPAPAAQSVALGTNPVGAAVARTVDIPGVPGLGVPGVSIRPRSMEDLVRAQVASKLAEPVKLGEGDVLTIPGTGQVLAKGGTKPVSVGPGATLVNPDAPAGTPPIAVGGAAPSEFGQFQQIYAEGLGAKTFGELTPAQKAGAIPAYTKAKQDPAVMAQLAALRNIEIQTKQAGLPGGGGSTPLGVTGDDAIKDLAPDQQRMVKLLADYKFPLPSGQALRTPYWQGLIGKVAAYDPSFDATQYQARQKLRTDFTSGQGARNIRSLNTAVGHLDTLNKAGTDLGNGSIPLWNTIANKGITAVGDPRVTRFNTAANAVESELASVFKGTGASDQEIKAWRSTLNESQSPAQLKGAIDQAIELMNSRLGAMQSQWETGMGGPKDFQILNPQSKSIIGRLTGAPGAAKPDAAAPVVALPQTKLDNGQIQVTAPDGSAHLFATQAAADRFKAAVAGAVK